MFGIYRLALALMVVVFHLSDHHPAGWYSVYAFYTLSGFLMTLVITKKYAATPAGVADFAVNRALRIYPPYLAMVAITVVMLQFPGLSARARQLADIGMPEGPAKWFENIFIWGWRMRDPMLVPQAWTIFRELFFCVLIFFPFARYRWLALAWFAGGLGYAGFVAAGDRPLVEIYTNFPNAGLCYAAGCCLFHFKRTLRPLSRPLVPLLVLTIIAPFVLEAVRPRFFTHGSVAPLYLNAFFSAYLVMLLSTIRGTPDWADLDRRLGNLSYPIYLCHYHVAVAVAALLGWPMTRSDNLLVACALPTLAVAWLLNRWIERTIGYGFDQRRRPWSSRPSRGAGTDAVPGASAATSP